MSVIFALVAGGIYLIYRVIDVLFDYLIFSLKKQPQAFNFQDEDVDGMTGQEFERYCIQLLVKTGLYTRAQMTDVTNDYGADIVAVDNEGNKWVFQCKRYNSNLNNKPIQEVIASKAHYKATKAAVITNSWFTNNARVLGQENGVLLIDRAELKKLEEKAFNKEREGKNLDPETMKDSSRSEQSGYDKNGKIFVLVCMIVFIAIIAFFIGMSK